MPNILYLADIRKLFRNSVDLVNGKRYFYDPDEFISYMKEILGNNFYVSGLDEKLRAAYNKFVVKTGALTANSFAATFLDITLGENSYQALKKDAWGRLYFNQSQTRQVASALNTHNSETGPTLFTALRPLAPPPPRLATAADI